MDDTEKSFIPRTLRPDVFQGDGELPLSADLPGTELRRKASDLLGAALRHRLGVADPDATPLVRDDVYGRRSDVAWTAVDGEAVLLDLSSGYYFSLNGVGTAIWEMLDGQRTLGDVHDAICARFRVDAPTAWEDIAALIMRLHGERLICAP